MTNALEIRPAKNNPENEIRISYNGHFIHIPNRLIFTLSDKLVEYIEGGETR